MRLPLSITRQRRGEDRLNNFSFTGCSFLLQEVKNSERDVLAGKYDKIPLPVSHLKTPGDETPPSSSGKREG